MRIEIQGLEPFDIEDSATDAQVKAVVQKLIAEKNSGEHAIAPGGAGEGLWDSTKKLVAEKIPFLAEDVAKVKPPTAYAPTPTATPEPVGAKPRFADIGGGKATEIGTPWSGTGLEGMLKQGGAQIAEELPGIGQAAGTAAGMGTALATEGALGPVAIPAGAGAGRIAGEAGKTVLQRLLGMKTELPSAGQLGESGLAGAEQGAIDAVTGRVLPTLAGGRPLEAMEKSIPAGQGPFAKTEKYLTKRLLQPAAGSTKSVAAVSRENIPLSGGKGAEVVKSQKRGLSGQVEGLIGDASEAGKKVSSSRIEKEINSLADELLTKSDDAKDAAEVLDYWTRFKELHPEEQIDPVHAHEVKKFIYRKIPEKYWTGKEGYNPLMEARKKAGLNIMTQLEEAAPEIGPLNEQLGRYITAEPDVIRATERIQGEPMRKRVFNVVKEKGAQALRKGRMEGNPEDVAARRSGELTRTGSPIQTLEDLFGTRYGAPAAEEAPTLKQLTADAGKYQTGEMATPVGPAPAKQLPAPQLKLPAPEGNITSKEYTKTMEYGGGPETAEQAFGKAILSEPASRYYPTKVGERAMRTQPVMNVTKEGQAFTNEPFASNVAYEPAPPIEPVAKGPASFANAIRNMGPEDRQRLMEFMDEVEKKHAARIAAKAPEGAFPPQFPNLSKILQQTKGQ